MNKINLAIEDIVDDIDRIKQQVITSGLSNEDEETLLTSLNTVGDKLEALAAANSPDEEDEV